MVDESPTTLPVKTLSQLQAPLLNARQVSERTQVSVEDLPHSKRPVDDLFDFTQEFIERGYHAEYADWRDSYLKWRQGDAKGAKGENAHTTHLRNRKQRTFEYWYPTVSNFNFRRTCAYWIGVLFVEGCLFFLWPPLFESFWPGAPLRMTFWISKIPLLVGTSTFGSGIYMGYLELINMDVDVAENRANLIWCDWRALYRLLLEAKEEGDSGDDGEGSVAGSEVYWYQPLSSILGWAIYLTGAVLFQVANTADILDMSKELHVAIVEWPLIFGGLCFFLGGIMEVVHNRCWATPPDTYVWWSSVLNFFGGIAFWLCACPETMGNLTTAIGVGGTVLYLIGAVLGLCMWRGEQFGLSLISNLNRVQRVDGTKIAVRTHAETGASEIVPIAPQAFQLDDTNNALQPKLSWRGLVFVLMCVLWGTASIVHVFAVPAAPWEFESTTRTYRRHLLEQEMTSVVHAIGAHLIILLNSATVNVPSEEPFRFMTLALRLLVAVLTVQSVMSNWTFLVDEHD